MKDIFLFNLAQSLIFILCWILLPFRNNHAAWFRKRVYQREQFIVFAIAFALALTPIALSLKVSYSRAFLVTDLNIGSCLLISLIWRPRYAPLTKKEIAARILASYIWPLSLIVPLHNLTQSRHIRSYT